MSLLLGLDAGGARHVLPDPGRLPSSHQGQKIHRLLLGIPCPGSPLGTARYLPKTTGFSFITIPTAPQALHSFPSPAPPQLPSDVRAEAWQQTGSWSEKCHREFIAQRKQQPAQPSQLPPGKAEAVLGLHLQKTALVDHCVTAQIKACHSNPEGSWHCSYFYNAAKAGFSGRFPTPNTNPGLWEAVSLEPFTEEKAIFKECFLSSLTGHGSQEDLVMQRLALAGKKRDSWNYKP